MSNKEFGIIAIGYNRPNSLQRLLEALNRVEYEDKEVLLIISLDYSGMPEMSDVAENYTWNHGRKIVKAYPERQGLQKHILQCGDYLEEFDLEAAAIFEDDIMPSPAFFRFMVQAVDFYKNNDEIAGISLYTHLWNEVCGKPFQPLYSRYDTFFMQYAQSWGQIWLPKQWKEFKEWYQNHSEPFTEAKGVPATVCQWKNSSWLKYHIRYCVEKNKYFVYPYESLSTNFTEIGTHNGIHTALYQVPLQTDLCKNYVFPLLSQAPVKYDVFFENQSVDTKLNIQASQLCVDLYGNKPEYLRRKYWLTLQKAGYKIEKSYGLAVRPHELNVILNIPGNEIRLYNTEQYENNTVSELPLFQQFDYYYRLTPVRIKELTRLLIAKIRVKIQNKFK